MKKMNIFKFTLTLVLAFVITGAFAQIPTPTAGDYSDGNVTTSTKVTIGTTVPFWVDADDYFNPNWATNFNAAATNVLKHDYVSTLPNADIVSTFSWSIVEIGGYDLSGTTGNYVEIAATAGNGFAAGSAYTLRVAETNGGCSGANINLTVNVVAEPTMSWVTADQDACTPVTSSVVSNILGDPDGDDMTLFWAFSASNVDGDWDGVFPVNVSYNETDITAAAAAAELVTDYDFAGGTAQLFGATGNQTLIASQDWDAMNSAITIYTFSLESVTDKVSRKSDYLSVYNAADLNVHTIYTQYGTSDVVRIVVRPAPQTGPIYHITNTWGL